ncbi:hypothetical protein SAMN02799630_02551 [Paenibacillus sp. UNCCL117]|uniref:hypothetical protein n=1 Tax=unclassified Paenibacillus TaxID=185978 RepID=UPI00088C0ABA|nr:MULTISPECIES: hypothetical protein [unclassified Paenibacillus]SDC05528.1 hypothetical protein SAMN04488602_101220 [Paenibacillus sp. cl123]SFW37605.1 hypothetical protein SAMN02799630_02551 [Paenibacillus sp. UNCCL117]
MPKEKEAVLQPWEAGEAGWRSAKRASEAAGHCSIIFNLYSTQFYIRCYNGEDCSVLAFRLTMKTAMRC